MYFWQNLDFGLRKIAIFFIFVIHEIFAKIEENFETRQMTFCKITKKNIFFLSVGTVQLSPPPYEYTVTVLYIQNIQPGVV